MAPSWMRTIAAICVSGVWVAALVIGTVQENWTPLTVTTPIMAIFTGFVFGVSIIRRQSDDSDR